MRKKLKWITVCLITAVSAVFIAHSFSQAVTVLAEGSATAERHQIVIDPGHGEPDGGTTSCSGRLEHLYNLEISLRLKDLMELLGFETIMTRKDSNSVFTEGTTISAKKRSDLKERVRIANKAVNGILVSIHQNHFPDSRFSGPVVLYAPTYGSRPLAEKTQQALIAALDPGSNRQCKAADSIYLMQHIRCPGILVECGFLSNTAEEAKLRSDTYQKQLCCVLAATISEFLSDP